ncbi:MAG: hypothetical protein FJY17_10360 [Bacteroidetes bacterium]|nr:hypothetical protein [Bacteroidota bacterium]
MLKKKFIKEAPIDYGDRPERMDSGTQRKIETGQTPISKQPFMPKITGTQTFEEVIASERFKQVIENIRRYTDIPGPVDMRNISQLQMLLMSALREIVNIERQHKEYLENLSIELVRKELEIGLSEIEYESYLVSPDDISNEGFQMEPEEKSVEEIAKLFQTPEKEEDEEENPVESLLRALEEFNIERSKRRLINMFIQGAGAKAQYMYHLIEEKLNELDPRLLNLYGTLMSVNEMLYWILNENMLGNLMGSKAGSVEVDTNQDPPKVVAKGVIFPVLLHELVKGTYEVIGKFGLPSNPEKQKMVTGYEDTLPAEVWDLRFGPVFWERLLNAYPNKIFESGQRFIQNYLFQKFVMMSAEEFIDLTKMILLGNPKANQILDRMVKEISERLRELENEASEKDEDDELGDINIDDIFNR